MKHIQLYENFQTSKEIIFDWMPFDKQVDNPIQSQIPASLSLMELKDYVASASPEVEKAGLFISHIPGKDNGFQRYVVTGFNPLKLNLTKWNSNYEKESEVEDIDPDKINLGDLSKGASIISRFSDLS